MGRTKEGVVEGFAAKGQPFWNTVSPRPKPIDFRGGLTSLFLSG